MAELPTIDTSSYPKPSASPSVLDTVGKLQGLEGQRIAIDQSKLDLVNQRYGIVSKELQGLIGDPDLDFNKVAARTQNLVNLGLMPPEMMTQFLKDAPTEKAQLPQYLQMKLQQSQDIMSAINYGQGQPQLFNDQNRTYQGTVSAKPPQMGGGIKINPNAIMDTKIGNQEVPDTDPASPTYGQRRFNLPANGPLVAPQQPQALPVGPVNNPAIRGQSDNFGGNVTGAEVGPNLSGRLPIQPSARVAQGFPSGPQGPASTMQPNYEEGRQAWNKDMDLATQKLTAVKPALQALDLMKGLRSGPGTETWNKAVAFGKANGIIPITANDPTAIYQEVNKYLNQYVQGSGTRSDADLAQREISNPNVTQQISPALEKLTRTQIARDRIEAARGSAFSNLDENGKPRMRQDFDKYKDHSSKFPPKMDERAFILDKMDDKERQDLFKELVPKAKKGDKSALRFFQSLEIAKRTGVFQ